MNNKLNGNRFEQELAQVLAGHGFWVHVLQQNKAGQPADIIAVKGRYATLIDCKVISNDGGFPLRRVEENQRFAMQRFSDRAHSACWFAIRIPSGKIFMVSSIVVFEKLRDGLSSISEREITENNFSLGEWMEYVESEA